MCGFIKRAQQLGYTFAKVQGLLPPLFHATLLWVSNEQLAVTGFERAVPRGDFSDFAHTWLCEKVEQGGQ